MFLHATNDVCMYVRCPLPGVEEKETIRQGKVVKRNRCREKYGQSDKKNQKPQTPGRVLCARIEGDAMLRAESGR